VKPARVIVGSRGWYVVEALPYDSGVILYGPVLAVEMAHELAEECDVAHAVRMQAAMFEPRRSLARC
jgi:hypothetical protein